MHEPIDTIQDKIDEINRLNCIIDSVQTYCVSHMSIVSSLDERTVHKIIFDKIERLKDE